MPIETQREIGKFDRYAQGYESAHARSLRASGEAPAFFARHKLDCLRRCGVQPGDSILDYGCGTGQLTRLLAAEQSSVFGYDPSARSLQVARRSAPKAHLVGEPGALPEGHFDAAVLAGVLHHVAPARRHQLLATVLQKLRPGGRLFVFEHNPLNPLTRRAVRDCPFDDDAVLLWPREIRALLRAVGFSRVRQRYVLFFPRALGAFRPLEPLLARCPLGAQTLTLGARA